MAQERTADGILAPSGKSAADENFPVGSILIARRLRPHVARFYSFARNADDIADDPRLPAAEKLARLDAFAAGLAGGAGAPGVARDLAESLRETGVSADHALNLLRAFRQDATKSRYADWAELIGYCALSANPVGAFLLDLHGEDAGARAASDALCTALQILNHLQDVQDDLRRLDRCYLPQDWLADECCITDGLLADRSSPGVRRVIDRVLAALAPMIDAADDLPRRLRSRRLAAESRVICRLARRLAGRLGRGDPLAGRVALTRGDFAAAAISGLAVLASPFRRAARE